MAHLLNGALAHLDRADRNILELEAFVQRYLRANKDDPFANYDPEPEQLRSGFKFDSVYNRTIFPPPSIDGAVLVSAIIHHLRAALDYLIYELASEDSSGIAQNGTQFPIEDVKSDPNNPKRGFDYRTRTYLKGLSPAHVANIEQLQPYNGVPWTKALRDISNPDKHRKLTAIRGRDRAVRRIVSGQAGSFEGKPGKVFTGAGRDGDDVYLETHYSIRVDLPEWNELPVVDALKYLQRNVRATIEAFHSEFE
jgi:hypothetical protein